MRGAPLPQAPARLCLPTVSVVPVHGRKRPLACGITDDPYPCPQCPRAGAKNLPFQKKRSAAAGRFGVGEHSGTTETRAGPLVAVAARSARRRHSAFHGFAAQSDKKGPPRALPPGRPGQNAFCRKNASAQKRGRKTALFGNSRFQGRGAPVPDALQSKRQSAFSGENALRRLFPCRPEIGSGDDFGDDPG